MATAWRWSRQVSAGVHELARDGTLRLRAGRAELAVRVAAGCVLVTREGDPDDHVLGPGDELRLAGRGLAVAWALSTARVVVSGGRASTPGPAARSDVLASVT
jgi:hypothetical protein